MKFRDISSGLLLEARRSPLSDVMKHAESIGVKMDVRHYSHTEPGEEERRKGWNLAWIERTTGEKGAGSKALTYLNKKADKHNKKVYIQVDDKDNLEDYYSRHEYDHHSYNEDGQIMVREPRWSSHR